MDDDFLFTKWFYNQELHKFYLQNLRDLVEHDRCGHCNVWIVTQNIDCEDDYTCLWQCPNCKATDKF